MCRRHERQCKVPRLPERVAQKASQIRRLDDLLLLREAFQTA